MYSAASILEDQIDAEKDEGGRETVGTFMRHVEARVEESVGDMREESGDDVRGIAGEAMATVRGWAESKRALLSSSYEIDDTAQKGAAAWFEPGSGKTVFDESVMDQDADKGYWARTRTHEEQHQGEANMFNSGGITFRGRTYAARPTLTEGRATQHQPDSDLVPSYIQYRNIFRQVASYLGSRAPIDAAIESGDIVGLQEKINARDGSSLRESKTPPASGRFL
ncbi:hypothetical protein HYZ98_05175 [Candidatus Peregrinibacteria bacterium]|nr:hypothetical protein [Candidatus Peregrinibacteria bacterium]